MARRPITIDRETLIPVGVVISIIGVVWFVSQVYAQVESNTRSVETFLNSVSTLNDKLTITNNHVIELNATLQAQQDVKNP